MALLWASIGRGAAVPTCAGVRREKHCQELRGRVFYLRGFLGFSAAGGQDTQLQHSWSTQEVSRRPAPRSPPPRKRFSHPPSARGPLRQLQFIFVTGESKQRGQGHIERQQLT